MVDNVPPAQAWEALRSDPKAQLVDVRTDVEWNFVGVPDLAASGKQAVLIPWQVYPSMQVNGKFVDQLKEAGFTPDHHVYFMCRTGGRSAAAAKAAQDAGYGHVFNVVDGFEGPPDANGHRGTQAGWKAQGLPWRQK
ncbi:MAG: rhodanese-like domain-containing protein [Acetobacteraceae bacterium]